MKFIADLHFHSKYSRAVSPKMTLENFAIWGKKKGIDILTTTDFTHPLWVNEIEEKLKEVRKGIFQLKNEELPKTFFVLTTEVSLIYKQHKIHLVVFSPNLETVKKINQTLTKKGFNLTADGRPILGTTTPNFMKLLGEIDKNIFVIPAHIWTPWFSLFGSRSGFNSIKECFQKYARKVTAVETGLSSDPLMNWQARELDGRIITSFSDAHSLENLGREVTFLELPKKFEYNDLITAFKTSYPERVRSKKPYVISTLEFYPEEGKYHYTGHRKCQVCQSPEETKRLGTQCPVCGKQLTVGVAHRVKELSRKEKIKEKEKKEKELKIISHPQGIHHPFVSLVPLKEIIAEAEGVGPKTKKVQKKYDLAIEKLGGEIKILLETPLEKINSILGPKIEEGVRKNRGGNIFINPGYDGLYGTVKIWPDAESKKQQKQMSLI